MELLNTRMQSMGLEPVTGPQSLETLLQDESHRQFLDDIRQVSPPVNCEPITYSMSYLLPKWISNV